jgi:hypothetical protein
VEFSSTEAPRYCGSGTCIIDAEGRRWCVVKRLGGTGDDGPGMNSVSLQSVE